MKNLFTTSMVLLSFAALQAQTDVVLTVDDTNNKTKTGIKFKGQFNSWAEVSAFDDGTNGDATAGDKIWSLKVSAADGTYEWGAVDQDGAWLTPGVPNSTFTVSGSSVTGTTSIVIPKLKPMHSVVFTVRDLPGKETMIKLKGSMFGWSTKDMFDDGTNGDTTANDKVFTLKTDIEEGNWEWGIENQCGWKLQGSNRQFTVAVGGAVSGSTSYSIPAGGTPINVTFRVYMGDVIVNSNGLYVGGDFMDQISGKSLCNWTKDTLRLADANSDDVFEMTLSIPAAKYSYKYFNGRGGDPDGEKGDFKTGGCGTDNGLGGFNRVLDLTGITRDTVLHIYKYDSCSVYTPMASGLNKGNSVVKGIFPNPASATATVMFHESGVAHVVTLFDMAGKAVSVQTLSAGKGFATISRPGSGMYLVQVADQRGGTAYGRIIFE